MVYGQVLVFGQFVDGFRSGRPFSLTEYDVEEDHAYKEPDKAIEDGRDL